MTYRGRFAPSPTGPLHLGSLIAALASYLDARQANGTWLVRMDDLDPPREEPGAADTILASLHAHGLHWDEPVVYQSQRDAAYRDALNTLHANSHLFYCECTRAMQGPEGICCGNCSYRQEWVDEPRAVRARVPANTQINYIDLIQREQRVALGEACPDFIVKRKDGLNAYQLAVVVDDASAGITHVVRGSDLLDTTPRQIYLQTLLGHVTPVYAHLPVITTSHGQKFSKQNHAPPLIDTQANQNIRRALQFLNQAEPDESLDNVEELLRFAVQHWSLEAVPQCLSIAAGSLV